MKRCTSGRSTRPARSAGFVITSIRRSTPPRRRRAISGARWRGSLTSVVLTGGATMPLGPIVDSHVHLWDPTHFRMPWLDGNATLDKPYGLSDYRAHSQGVEVEA